MAEQKEAQFNSIDDLFGADLDDIADLAAFEVPPPGVYALRVSMDIKTINDKPAIESKFTVLSTEELKIMDESSPKYRPPVKEGTEFNIAFIMGNAVAEGRLKQFLIPFAEHFNIKGKGAVGTLVKDTIKDVTIAATITNRPDKDDPERIYAGIKNIMVV